MDPLGKLWRTGLGSAPPSTLRMLFGASCLVSQHGFRINPQGPKVLVFKIVALQVSTGRVCDYVR